jgi:hypothetical protein
MLTEMASGQPDVIVFELGDGLLGTYGVEAILRDPDIKAALTAVVLSANDPVAAWGGVKLLRERFGIEPCAVTGSRDRQSGRGPNHPRADECRSLQCDQPSGGSRRSHHRASRHRERARIQGSRRRVAGRANEPANELVPHATPTIVLGGTGYVAGELLRLIAGHPQLAKSRRSVGQPARRPWPPRSRICKAPIRILSSPGSTRSSADATHAGDGPVLGRAARRRRAIIDRLLKIAEISARKHTLCRHLRRFSLRAPLPTRRSTNTRMARRRASRIHLRGAGTFAAAPTPHIAHPGCFATATLLASVPLLAAGFDRAAPVRDRHHRQHRFRPQTGRGHAPSAAAQRFVYLRRAQSPACSRDRRLREVGDRVSRRNSISCRIPARSLAAST